MSDNKVFFTVEFTTDRVVDDKFVADMVKNIAKGIKQRAGYGLITPDLAYKYGTGENVPAGLSDEELDSIADDTPHLKSLHVSSDLSDGRTVTEIVPIDDYSRNKD